MISQRSLFSLIAAHGFIYAIGGNNGKSLSTVERYDASANLWIAVESMIKPRVAAAAAALNGNIFVMGGSTEINSCETASVEKFSGETEKWTLIAQLCLARDFL